MNLQLRAENFNTVNFRFRSAGAWLDNNDEVEGSNIFEKVIGFFSIKHLTKKIRESNEDLSQKIDLINQIEVSKDSIARATETHKSLINLIDTLFFIKDLDTSKTTNTNVLDLANEMKKAINLLMDFELAIRVKFFPEENKVILTYEELKELRECMRGWESAEEQSDIYS